jgi:hypothetical protein
MELRIINSHLTMDYLKKYANGDIFVETGTYLGDTVHLALDFGFKKIHTIELNEELWKRAGEEFKDKDVMVWLGDSVESLEDIHKRLPTDEPVTYWLDAHASGPLPGGKSGGSPVLDELRIIKKHGNKNSTIFIDDRRLFGSAEWSYVKEEDAMALLKEINPEYNIYHLDGHIENDVICATIK